MMMLFFTFPHCKLPRHAHVTVITETVVFVSFLRRHCWIFLLGRLQIGELLSGRNMTLSPLPSYLRGVNFPIFFENALNRNGWELDKLTFSNLAEVLSGRDYEFRLGAKESGDIVWEGWLQYAHYLLSSRLKMTLPSVRSLKRHPFWWVLIHSYR